MTTVFLLTTIYEWYHMTRYKTYLLPGILFLILSFFSAYSLRELDHGLTLFLFVIIICVFTDVGGYVFGRLFKGPKLTKISPNKTYSGMFGGFFLSVIAFTLFAQNLDKFGLSSVEVPIEIEEFLFVFLISLVSQLGDLLISFFKRLSKLKNTGKLFPGHGGLLDRIDGMIFAIPFVYLVNLLII